jgi:hypothetical protein
MLISIILSVNLSLASNLLDALMTVFSNLDSSVHYMVDCYPNICITYRILLAISMIIASTETSFSKLKLLKK